MINYLGYGMILGLCIHGFKGCDVCGPKTKSKSTNTDNKLNAKRKVKRSKVIFGGGRQWTRRHHIYCNNLKFNGKVED
jgi:hypothetical protein